MYFCRDCVTISSKSRVLPPSCASYVMFHMVFQKNEEALKGLVAVLMRMDEKDIRECRIENPIKPGTVINDKSCTLDILLTLNNERSINIEMQVARYKNWSKRSLFYWSRMYANLPGGA